MKERKNISFSRVTHVSQLLVGRDNHYTTEVAILGNMAT